MLKLSWLNTFWLLVPILVWNLVFASRLAHPGFEADENVPQWLLITENVLRGVVMLTPLFMALNWDSTQSKAGWVVYGAGMLVYFASWIPLMVTPESAWSNSLVGFTAPAYTPLLWLVGIGLITWLLIRTLRGHFNRHYYAPVDLVGLYWHLVDLIWIFLFPLLYLIE